MRDTSKSWHFLWGKMVISHQVEGFSPIDVQRNPKNGAGLPWSMEYRRPSWHPLRYQGCHGCRMRTGNCSLEWNLPGCIPMLSSWFWAGWFGSSGALFNWDCHYGILWVPMSFFCRWASWLVQHDWGCCTKTTQYLWLFPGSLEVWCWESVRTILLWEFRKRTQDESAQEMGKHGTLAKKM